VAVWTALAVLASLCASIAWSAVASAADPVEVHVGTSQALEPDGGARGLFVPVHLSAPSEVPIVVSFHTVDDTALAGTDYTRWGTPASPRSVTIPAGSIQTTINVPVLADEEVEPDEQFDVVLDSVSGGGAVIGTGTAQLTVLDVDVLGSPLPAVAVTSASVHEGDDGERRAQFHVQLSRSPATPVQVAYATADGTASSPEDYVAVLPGTLSFAPGQITRTVDVRVPADLEQQGDREFTLVISLVGGTAVEEVSAVGTMRVIDDDAPAAAVVEEVVTGADHSCARWSDGSVTCWGDNSVGQLGDGTTVARFEPVGVTGLSGVVALDAGDLHTCAVRDDGGVWCWGAGGLGRLGDGTTSARTTPVQVTGLTTAVDVAAGGDSSCAVLSDRSARCWGGNQAGQLGNGSFTTFSVTPVVVNGLADVVDLRVGGSHACAVLLDGTARCWGNHSSGQLGTNLIGATSSLTRTPNAVVGLSDLTQIATGKAFSCALRSDGSVWCWGDNGFGQLGTNTFSSNANVPLGTIGLTGADVLGAGSDHACALRDDGAGWCWGSNVDGKLGNGLLPWQMILSRFPVAVSVPSGATSVDGGTRHTCMASATGPAHCWGTQLGGRLGNGRDANALTPVPATALGSPSLLSDACAVTWGQLQCWGSNVDGRLGGGSTAGRVLAPVAVPSPSDVVHVASGRTHACSVGSDGTVQCWGKGTSGQLGNGAVVTSAAPVPVSGISTAIAVGVGLRHSCAVLADATVRCWGANDYGQLGNGSTVSSAVPVAPTGLGSVDELTVGNEFSCARSADGSVRCWGSHSSNQIGDGGGGLRRTTPSPVFGLTDAVAVSAGGVHACAVRSTGAVRCWGSRQQGQLGDGRTDGASSVPVDVAGITTAVSVSSGDSHSCSVLTGGGLRCWGSGGSGELGRGSTNLSAVPVAPSGIPAVTTVRAAGYRTCATAGEALLCWGSRGDGELGDGIPGYLPSATPVLGT
jgi:alpha-tubulin suppressor-like RCC1 family protein